MNPDYCSSITCDSYGCDYCSECSHATFLGRAKVGNVWWRWELRPYYGLEFLKADGEPRDRWPGENHPVWDAFDLWYMKREYGDMWK